jgi:hypothetical protein
MVKPVVNIRQHNDVRSRVGGFEQVEYVLAVYFGIFPGKIKLKGS